MPASYVLQPEFMPKGTRSKFSSQSLSHSAAFCAQVVPEHSIDTARARPELPLSSFVVTSESS